MPTMFLSAPATVTSALTGALSTIASDMTGAVAAVVPIAVPVLGGILVVTLGIKAFKKFTK